MPSTPAADLPGEPPRAGRRRLNICVLFTSPAPTLAALKKAGGLAENLGARITLLVLHVVPFPLPLEDPPVSLGWSRERFRALAAQSPVDTVVRLYLCRDRGETLEQALSPKSVVVIGARNARWPFTAAARLRRQLVRAGHEVIFAESE